MVFVNPPAFISLEANQSLVTTDWRVYKSFQGGEHPNAHFGLEAELPGLEACVIFMPKSKHELDLLIAYATHLLGSQGDILLVGEKRGGVGSGAKKLARLGEPYKVDSAKHCQLWRVSLESKQEPFVLEDWFSSFSCELPTRTLEIVSIPGVFSFDRLDEGSALLLEALTGKHPKKILGRTLDFGCGSGVLGLAAKALYPDIALEMVDINWFALQCAERSAKINGLDAKIYASDGWAEVEGRVDAVISNPPFHSGISTEYQTSESFIRMAPSKMSKHSPLLLVANRFLKYPSQIETSFGMCDTVNQTGKFSVYLARR